MRLIILGAGGHGKVVADIAEQTGKYDEICFLDDHAEEASVLGKCEEFENYNSSDTEMYPAFGNNIRRVIWEQKIEYAGIKLAKIIHPLAYVSPKAEVTDGCVIMPYAVVNTGTILRQACIVNIGALVDHDCVLDEGCHIAPGAVVKGANHLPKGTKVDSGEVIALQLYK